MPIKDKEKNRKYQREWARKNGKTKKRNQVGFRTRQKMVDDAKSHPLLFVIRSILLKLWNFII